MSNKTLGVLKLIHSRDQRRTSPRSFPWQSSSRDETFLGSNQIREVSCESERIRRLVWVFSISVRCSLTSSDRPHRCRWWNVNKKFCFINKTFRSFSSLVGIQRGKRRISLRRRFDCEFVYSYAEKFAAPRRCKPPKKPVCVQNESNKVVLCSLHMFLAVLFIRLVRTRLA